MASPVAAKLVGLAEEAARAARLVPVGTNTNFPFQASSTSFTAGNQTNGRTMHYLPKGGSGIRLLLVGGVYAGAVETALTAGFPLKLAFAKEPKPWNAVTTYSPGDQVVYHANINNPYFVCAVANTNSPPSATNTNWTAGTRPTTYPVTFNGLQDCTFGTQTLPDGTTVAKGSILTDPLSMDFAAGDYLGIYHWAACTGSQVFPVTGQSLGLHIGTWLENSTTVTDKTVTGFGNARSTNSPSFLPAAIIGIPKTATPTVAVIGDSISQGKTGSASLSGITIVSGGTGYKQGDILTLPRTGATAGAVAAGSDAQVIVDSVSSGVITALRVINPGGYTNTATHTGQTLPSGTLALSGGSGSGATATATFATNPYDIGDGTGAQGYMARALSSAGIPHAMFAASGDRLSLWTGGRAHTRFASVAASGATTAIVAMGRNDLTNGDSAATIQANFVLMVARLKGLGIKRVIGATVTPETTSTTTAGASSVADQAVTSNNTARQTLNAWLRGTSHPFDAVIDVAAAVEDGGASAPTGKFIVIGGEAAAADGKHPGVSAIALMKATVAASVGLLV